MNNTSVHWAITIWDFNSYYCIGDWRAGLLGSKTTVRCSSGLWSFRCCLKCLRSCLRVLMALPGRLCTVVVNGDGTVNDAWGAGGGAFPEPPRCSHMLFPSEPWRSCHLVSLQTLAIADHLPWGRGVGSGTVCYGRTLSIAWLSCVSLPVRGKPRLACWLQKRWWSVLVYHRCLQWAFLVWNTDLYFSMAGPLTITRTRGVCFIFVSRALVT